MPAMQQQWQTDPGSQQQQGLMYGLQPTSSTSGGGDCAGQQAAIGPLMAHLQVQGPAVLGAEGGVAAAVSAGPPSSGSGLLLQQQPLMMPDQQQLLGAAFFQQQQPAAPELLQPPMFVLSGGTMEQQPNSGGAAQYGLLQQQALGAPHMQGAGDGLQLLQGGALHQLSGGAQQQQVLQVPPGYVAVPAGMQQQYLAGLAQQHQQQQLLLLQQQQQQGGMLQPAGDGSGLLAAAPLSYGDGGQGMQLMLAPTYGSQHSSGGGGSGGTLFAPGGGVGLGPGSIGGSVVTSHASSGGGGTPLGGLLGGDAAAAGSGFVTAYDPALQQHVLVPAAGHAPGGMMTAGGYQQHAGAAPLGLIFVRPPPGGGDHAGAHVVRRPAAGPGQQQQHKCGIDPRLIVGTPVEVAWEVMRRLPGLNAVLELERERACLRNLPVQEDPHRDAAAAAAAAAATPTTAAAEAAATSPVLLCGSPASVGAAGEGLGSPVAPAAATGEAAAGAGSSSGGGSNAELEAPLVAEQLLQEQGLVRACRGLPARVRDDLIRAARLAVTRADPATGAQVAGTGLLPFFWRVQFNLRWLLRQPATLKGQLQPGQIDFITDEQRIHSFRKTVAQRARLGEIAVLLHGLLQVPADEAPVMAAAAAAAGVPLAAAAAAAAAPDGAAAAQPLAAVPGAAAGPSTPPSAATMLP